MEDCGFAWLIGIINGIIYIFWGIYALVVLGYFGILYASAIFWIIGGIINILLSLIFVRPRFSTPCKNKDWDALYNDYILLGNFKLPFMILLGILMEIFGYYWGGFAVLIPALILLFAGPKQYNWTV